MLGEVVENLLDEGNKARIYRAFNEKLKAQKLKYYDSMIACFEAQELSSKVPNSHQVLNYYDCCKEVTSLSAQTKVEQQGLYESNLKLLQCLGKMQELSSSQDQFTNERSGCVDLYIERLAQIYVEMKQDWREKSDNQSLLSSSSHQSQNNQLFMNYVDPKQQFKFNQSVRSNSNCKAIKLCQCSKQCDACLKKSVILEQTLTEMQSKIAELEIKISMSFTKHAQQSNLSSNLEQTVESMKFITQQTKDCVRECVKQLASQKIKQTDDESMMQRDIDNVYASLRNIEVQQERIIEKQEGSRRKMEGRQENLQDKMQKIVDTMGEMSVLQRKVLEGEKKIDLITCSPIGKANWHRQSPSFSRETSFDMTRKNLDSTHISYSRNFICK